MATTFRDEGADRAAWKGAIAGIAGGLLGAWVMNQFQAAPGSGSSQQRVDDDATVKAAEAVAEIAADRTLTREQKRAAGPAVHYAFGSTIGAAYGALAELTPRTAAGWGVPFGAAVWLGADELAVPALGLSKSPLAYPASTHASAFAAHLLYGVTADVTRRLVRAAL